MRSFKFPKMFNTNSSRIWQESEHYQATKQNAIIMLHCNRGEMFGDPYFGIQFKNYLFDQNNALLEDALIDNIYTQLVLFIPQLKINRSDIRISKDAELGKLYCTFDAIDQIDFSVNTYQLTMFQQDRE